MAILPIFFLHRAKKGCSLLISDDLNNFRDESIKIKMAAAAIYKN